MSENVSEASIDLNDMSVVESVLDDADLRKLPVGSEAFKAALAEKQSKMGQENDVTADDVDADQDESEEDVESEDDQTEKSQKPKRGMVKRIEELVQEREAERRRAAELEARLAAYEAKGHTKADTGFDTPKPHPDNFDSVWEYTEALTDWKLEKREFDAQMKQVEREAMTKQEQFLSDWTERENATKKEFRDYERVVNMPKYTKLGPSTEAQVFLAESEVGPKVIYSLLADEDLAETFAQASPVKQVAMLARIESRFDSEDAVTEKKTTVSKAPSPPRSLPRGKATGQVKDIYDTSLSFAEFDQAMRERERAKRK